MCRLQAHLERRTPSMTNLLEVLPKNDTQVYLIKSGPTISDPTPERYGYPPEFGDIYTLGVKVRCWVAGHQVQLGSFMHIPETALSLLQEQLSSIEGK